MPWPFRRKTVAPTPERKSSTFFFSPGAGRSGLTGAGYDLLATEGYIENVIAFACINRIAAAVASVEPQLYRKGKNGKLTKIDASPLLDLIENPNPTQSGKEFMRYLVAYQQLSGNAYVWGNGIDPMARKSKPPTELQLFNPGQVKVNPGAGLFPLSYEYKPSAATALAYPVDKISGRSAILHLKSFNPLSPWYGMSALSAAALAVDIHNDGQKWNKSLLENGARPSGALTVSSGDGESGTLSEDQYRRLTEMIDDQFSGTGNAGRPMLLEGGLDWKEMSLNPKDMEFMQGKHSAARDIALSYGIPPQLLGIPGDSTYSNMSEAKLALWTDTVLPLVCWILEGFNRWLTPLYGDDLYLWYDEDTIPALDPLRKQKADRIEESGYLTINEKRRAMGHDDIEGGDTLFVPAGNIPLELAGTVDPRMHPVLAGDTPQQQATAVADGAPLGDPTAKHRDWLIRQGYTPERAERLAMLVYG